MITGWLVKVVVAIALFGLLAFELGSPVVTRLQLDDLAHDAADSAALDLLNTQDPKEAEKTAKEIVESKNAAMKEFEIDSAGNVRITVERKARSVLLEKWSTTESWYDVEVKVVSEKKKP